MKQVCSSVALTATSHSRSKPKVSMIGKKMGNTIMTMPSQSMNMPRRNMMTIMMAKAPHLPIPMLRTQSAMIWSPSRDMNTPVKAAAPKRMMNTMAVVLAVSIRDS